MNIESLDLKSVTFPVVCERIYTKRMPTLNLFGKNEPIYDPIESFNAVLDLDNNHVFAVVAPGYKLITNKTALELGEVCFKTVFSMTDVSDMELFNIQMPSTRSFCHVDFKHKGAVFTPFKGDEWFPYLRITNSYNRMYALKFDLGFCRCICKNGVIFGKNNIEFKYHHTRTARDPIPEFKLRIGEFHLLEMAFQNTLMHLQRYHVPRKYMLPLFCKVFRQNRVSPSANDNSLENWELKHRFVEDKTKEYFDLLGENGYAALNVLTDYATRPIGVISVAGSVNTLQRLAGSWIEDFVNAIEQREFRFEEYLSEYIELAG